MKLHSLWLSSNVPPSSAILFNSATLLSTIFWLMANEVSVASQNFRYVGVVKNLQNRLSHPLLNFPMSAKESMVLWTILTVSLLGGSSYSPTLTSNAMVPTAKRVELSSLQAPRVTNIKSLLTLNSYITKEKVMRINKLITKGKMLWSFTKFSQLLFERNVSVWRICVFF